MTVIYRSALERTAGIVANVKPDQLDGETPCSDWNTRRLLNHLIGGVMGFAMATQGTPLDPNTEPPDIVGQHGDDAGKAFEAARAMAVEAWSAPDVMEKELVLGAPMPANQALRIALMEAVVHGWDVAKATGQDGTIDPMFAEPMLDGLKKMFGAGPRPPIIGPEVAVPDDASPSAKLVAFLGRTP